MVRDRPGLPCYEIYALDTHYQTAAGILNAILAERIHLNLKRHEQRQRTKKHKKGPQSAGHQNAIRLPIGQRFQFGHG